MAPRVLRGFRLHRRYVGRGYPLRLQALARGGTDLYCASLWCRALWGRTDLSVARGLSPARTPSPSFPRGRKRRDGLSRAKTPHLLGRTAATASKRSPLARGPTTRALARAAPARSSTGHALSARDRRARVRRSSWRRAARPARAVTDPCREAWGVLAGDNPRATERSVPPNRARHPGDARTGRCRYEREPGAVEDTRADHKQRCLPKEARAFPRAHCEKIIKLRPPHQVWITHLTSVVLFFAPARLAYGTKRLRAVY